MRSLLVYVSLLFCLSVLLPRVAKAQNMDAVPDTPAGKKLMAWLQAYNTGRREPLRQFYTEASRKPVADSQSIDERTDADLNFFASTHGLDVRKVTVSSPDNIMVFAQTRLTEGWLLLQMRVEPEPPYALRGLGVRLIDTPSEFIPHEKLTEKVVQAKLDALLKKMVAANGFSGAVLVAKDGIPFYKKAYGLANRAWQIPNRTDTRFNLGSMNKMFTAVAIAQLVSQGRFTYDDTLSKVLPDYPNQDVASKITIRQLLTHTSGMGDIFTDKFWEGSRLRFRTISDYFPLFVDTPLAFAAGTKWAYSNAGYLVLGAVITRISGEDYFDYIRKHIYLPAGMTNTDCYDLDTDPPNLATGYTYDGQKGVFRGTSNLLRTNTFLHVIKGGPSGGGYSTVDDLLKFATALRTHKLLNAEATSALWANPIKDVSGPGNDYGYGFAVKQINGMPIVGHSGAFPGINSELNIYLDVGYTVVILSNYDEGAMTVAAKLREWLTQGHLPPTNGSSH